MKKKTLNIYLILGTTSALSIIPVAIIGCSNNQPNNQYPQDINEELARVNQLNLNIINNVISEQEISNFLQNPLSFLNQNINGWNPNPNFTYNVELKDNKNSKQLRLKVIIISISSPNESQTSKEFVFNYLDLNDINQEIANINNSNIQLNKPEFTQSEINRINENNIIHYLVGYEFKKDIFTYQIDNFKKELLSFKFRFKIFPINNSSYFQYSKEFTTSFLIQEDEIEENTNQNLNLEVENINKSNIQLINDQELYQIEIDNINETVLLDYLTGHNFNSSFFEYQITNFQKTTSGFKFKIKVLLASDLTKIKYTQEFQTNYKVKQGGNSSSTTVEQEIARINEFFQTNLLKTNLTKKQLVNINPLNIFSKISNIDFFDTNKFKYTVHTLSKFLTKPKGEILVNFKVFTKDGKAPLENWTNTWKLKFNLYSKENDYVIQTDYLKNNLIDPINDGRYYFSKYDGGTGKDSITINTGERETTPSEGVPPSGLISSNYIYNETEQKQLKNTFSLAFISRSGIRVGTGWILDYKLEDNGEYPTTWYIATNAHVIQNLKVPNDIISPERYENGDKFGNTDYLEIKTPKDPQIGKRISTLSSFDPDTLSAEIPPINLKTVFIGTDIMKTSPSNFTTSGKWQDTEEYLDFAVMEVKFKDANEAQKMTQNYVNEPNRHFKYKKRSLLKDEVKKDYYSIVGFPGGDKSGNNRESNLFSSRGVNNKNEPTGDKNKLTNLATTPYYNTFNNKLGMFDGAIGFPNFGMFYRQAFQLEEWYNSWGLIYPVDYGNLGPGSSGSMLMDKDGYTVGIHFAIDTEATLGFSQALYCEGFNYQGKFGSYNLQGYDLIEGGFPDQRTSYKDNLKKLYGTNFKTKLFPDGIK